jgi:DNA-directed RNA polymerase subunit H
LPGDILVDDRHYFVSEHVLIPVEDAKELMKELGIDLTSLPRISKSDPAIKSLKAEIGDVVKIIRDSITAGQTTYYRLVIK